MSAVVDNPVGNFVPISYELGMSMQENGSLNFSRMYILMHCGSKLRS